jgi:dTDP-4-dehydrorhamnose reductase
MKIYILGYKGMLGRYVYTYFKSKNYDVIGLSRDDMDITTYSEVQLRAVLLHRGFKKGDVVINCIGTIKPMVDKYGILNAIKVNSLFPHVLSNVCESEGYKMIHITTDCVFSGNKGNYTENDPHDVTDVYGRTKSLGEPENCTVIRTSIIGEEIGQGRSLIEWIKSMKDKTANGFSNHQWNGLTCLHVAKVFETIISHDLYWNGVRHIFSPNTLNKYELLIAVSNIYNLNIYINRTEAPVSCDRSLSTIYTDTMFDIPILEEQITEQRDFYSILSENIL